jgi:hypothetical protein
MINNKEYRVQERRMTSLEGSIFYYFIIQKRRFKHIGIDMDFFWNDVLNPSSTPLNRKYPYEFNSRKEAEEFIIDELIGKANYREKIIDEILK